MCVSSQMVYQTWGMLFIDDERAMNARHITHTHSGQYNTAPQQIRLCVCICVYLLEEFVESECGLEMDQTLILFLTPLLL